MLTVKNLNVQFLTKRGVVTAVQNLSYSLDEGEALGIVGESGCGKSVSVLALLRLLPPEVTSMRADQVSFGDIDLYRCSERELRHVRGNDISLVFQDPMASLNPVLTIGRQLKQPLLVHGKADNMEAYRQAVELLRLVQIQDPEKRMKQYPHELSGGMRQRVMIAMSLICNPRLLIADEPTTALDVTVQAQILDLVKDLRSKLNMSLIWISHDLGVIAGLADRVIVMYAGSIVEEASVDELFIHPQHPYTRALIASLPQKGSSGRRSLQAIEGLPPDLLNLPEGCRFAERCSGAHSQCRIQLPPLRTCALGHTYRCWFESTSGEIQ